jgi:hypothetical protein
MSAVRRSVRHIATASLTALSVMTTRASAQQAVQQQAVQQQAVQSTSASVSVSLRVLPQASFDGADQQMTASVLPGGGVRVDPSAGARTRMTYTAPMQVEVSGTALLGPGGAIVRVRYVCAFGGGTTVSAAEPFDCMGGLAAGLAGSRVASLPLAVGVELSARETLEVPPGLYVGRVTLTATHPAY